MNKTFYISLAVLIFITAACGRKKSKEIIYDDAELTEVKAVTLALKPMDTKDYFVNPQSIDFIRDSLLLIMDRNNGDYVCHIINKKGEVKKAFGRRGKAKNELVQPANCSVSADGDSVYIYDSMLMKLLGYSLDDVMDGDVNPHSVCDMGKMLTSAGINNTRIWTVHNIGKNRFLGFTGNENRIVTMEKGKVTNIYTDYLDIDPDPECKWSIWNNLALFTISPDKRHLVTTSYFGGLFETFDVNGGKPEQRSHKTYYKPTYRIAEGATPKCVAVDEKTIAGFRSACSNDRLFLTTMGGKEFKMMKDIQVYDYDGKLKKQFTVNGIPMVMGIDNDNHLFVFVADETTGKSTLSYAEPEL